MSLIIKRLTPYIVPLLTLILLEIAFAKPAKGWIFLLITFIIGLAAIINLSIHKLNKKTARFLLPTVLFLISFTFFFLFLVLASSTFKHIFAILIILIFGIALEIIFQLWNSQKEIRFYAGFFSYLNLLTIFMFFASLGSIGIFLGIANWILYIITALFSFIIFTSNYYLDNLAKDDDGSNLIGLLTEKIENLVLQTKSEKILFTIIPTLVLIEIFWSLSFLPTSIYVNAFIITVSYYLIAGIVRSRLLGVINSKIIKRYLFVGGACLILIVLTARV